MKSQQLSVFLGCHKKEGLSEINASRKWNDIITVIESCAAVKLMERLG